MCLRLTGKLIWSASRASTNELIHRVIESFKSKPLLGDPAKACMLPNSSSCTRSMARWLNDSIHGSTTQSLDSMGDGNGVAAGISGSLQGSIRGLKQSIYGATMHRKHSHAH